MCLRCGIIFSKYLRLQKKKPSPESSSSVQVEDLPDAREIIRELLFYTAPETHPVVFGGRVFFFLIIVIWGFKFIFTSWEFILKETGLQRYDHALASLSYMTGTILMICALAWSGYILLKQYKNINRRLVVMEKNPMFQYSNTPLLRI